MQITLENIIALGAQELNIRLPETAAAQFRTYYSLIEEKNKVMNLTAISGEADVSKLHFLDSLALLTICDFRGARVVDIGTGAGFPGLPLLIAEPTIKLTLLDSLGKRVSFLREVTTALGISVECLHARAEDAAREPGMRDKFDISVSRAVARLNMLCELCLPFVRPGGVFIAMKSSGTDDEIREAEGAAAILGGSAPETFDYSIPGADIVHRAVLIRKIKPTPKEYPRRFAKIQKSPL